MKRNGHVQKVVDEMVHTLVRRYRPRRVVLFGSYAYGRPCLDSDIDLLIIKETRRRMIDRWCDVQRILSDPKRKIPLETLVLTPKEVDARLKHGDQFLREIIEKGEVLYAA
jgi:predicted nucleotidyltransferase